MKNKFLQQFATADAEEIQAEKDIAQSNLDNALETLKQAKIDSDDVSSIYALEDVIESGEIRVAKLKNIRPERIQYEMRVGKYQHHIAETNYNNFDSDESFIAEKINLLHIWGNALVRAKICGKEIEANIARWRCEACLVHKQLAPKKHNQENCISIDTWLNALAQTIKIFAKLEIDKNHTLMFLSFALTDLKT